MINFIKKFIILLYYYIILSLVLIKMEFNLVDIPEDFLCPI
jgi:hypothetical protein